MYESNNADTNYSTNYSYGQTYDLSADSNLNSNNSNQNYNSYYSSYQPQNYQFLQQSSPASSTGSLTDSSINQGYMNYYSNNAYYPFQNSQYDPSYYSQSQTASAYSNSSYQTATFQVSTSPAKDQYGQVSNSNTSVNTPEKPIMNDSGIDVISPQLLANKNLLSTTSTPSQPTQQYAPQQTFPQQSNNSNQIAQADINDNDNTENDASDIESIVDEENDDESNDKENDCSQSKDKPKSKVKSDPAKPPKPYLEIIADAILSRSVKLMQLHEIYNFMENKYSYFAKNINKSWRNSVRHNLSLNECFVKAGRGTNGKGNYWRIHPLCEKEFIRGNFRRKSFKQLIKAGNSGMVNQNQASVSQPSHLVGYIPFSEYALSYRGINSLSAQPNQGFQQETSSTSTNFPYSFLNSQQMSAYNFQNLAQSKTSSNINPANPSIENSKTKQNNRYNPY